MQYRVFAFVGVLSVVGCEVDEFGLGAYYIFFNDTYADRINNLKDP